MALPHNMHLLRLAFGLLNTGYKVKYLIFDLEKSLCLSGGTISMKTRRGRTLQSIVRCVFSILWTIKELRDILFLSEDSHTWADYGMV